MDTQNQDSEQLRRRYQALLDLTGGGLWDWGCVANQIYYSENWKRILGSDIQGDPLAWQPKVHPEDWQACYHDLLACRAGRIEQISSLFRMRHNSGVYIWIWNRAMGFRNAQGLVERLIGVFQDVTVDQKSKIELKIQAKVLEDLNQQLFNLSILDDLTQLYNRRKFTEDLKQEIHRSHRYLTPLTLVFIDLDEFKEVNDRHGHAAGDAVLRQFSQILRALLRIHDLAYRIGGEEFAVLLPHTGVPEAVVFLERFQSKIRQKTDWIEGLQKSVTFSAGLVERRSAETAEEFMQRADQALYQAKQWGRDQIICSPCSNG